MRWSSYFLNLGYCMAIGIASSIPIAMHFRDFKVERVIHIFMKRENPSTTTVSILCSPFIMLYT